MMKVDGKISIIEHLEELRKRILICLAFILVFSVLLYFFSDEILQILAKPVGKLFFIKPAEAVFTKVKIAIYTGIIASIPVILYHGWTFIKPALNKVERQCVLILMPFSLILFCTGVLFAFFIVFPTGIMFFMSYVSENIEPIISMGAYVSFTYTFLLAFGVVFQLPVIIIVLTLLGVVTPKLLRMKRKYSILLVFVMAGILTPGPDLFSQFLMAGPLLVLYELSIFVSVIVLYFGDVKRYNSTKLLDRVKSRFMKKTIQP